METKVGPEWLIKNIRRYLQIPGWVILGFVEYLTVLLTSLKDYIKWTSGGFILGLLILPLVTRITGANAVHYRYAIFALLCAALSIFAPASTLLYFSIVFALLFVMEGGIGRVNLLPLLVAVLMSPMVQYAADVFSFPLRLHLTRWAGNAMQMVGVDVAVKGNMILTHGNEFAVDPACMGLSMLVVSLLTGLMMIAVYQKRYKRTISNRWLIPVLMVMVGLNMFSNIVRIICLVLFNLLPDDPAHSWIGIACLLLYVILPAMMLSRWLVRRFGVDNTEQVPVIIARSIASWRHLLVQLLVFLSVATASYIVKTRKEELKQMGGPAPIVAGYQTERVDAEIIKLQNPGSLVYIKHIAGFYSGDHHPMICWRGGGYAFRQVEQKRIAGTVMYTAKLDNGIHPLFTAWWYDNGSNRTINQFDWRWDVLSGAHSYSLINITAETELALNAAISGVMSDPNITRILHGM